jgi:CubicO group peptidase (beta-lactamase class C family)
MKKYLKLGFLVIVLFLSYIAYSYYLRLDILTGFASKSVTSGMFIANRTQESIETGDNNFSLVDWATNKVDTVENSVTSSLFGLKKRKSIYVAGLGAILLNDSYDSTKVFITPNRNKTSKNLPFPYGNLAQKDTIFNNVDYKNLEIAVADAFDRNDEKEKRSRSVIVVYKDHILAEKYATGFDQNTPILGWSMSKSITATIYGILENQGKIHLEKTTDLDAWENDVRSDITYSDLLHMNSGLEWEENYDDISDVTKMLYLESEMGKVQLNKPLVGKPNETWNYSSGTTNLLAGILLRKHFETHQEYVDFWYAELLDKIGMHSAIIETDLVGNYVGSSYAWANTRDWAKFGLLYLHEGNWNGEQIVDSAFVKYVATPTNTSNGRYGAHFWLNAGGIYPDVPNDMFSANGFQGQMVIIIPSKEIVIVRTGLVEDPDFSFNNFIASILKTIE